MCATHILTWNNNICWRTNERIERKGSSMKKRKQHTTKLYKVKHNCKEKQDIKRQREYTDVMS